MKESARVLILEAASKLQPRMAEITSVWRQRIFESYQFEGRVMVALERLTLGVGFTMFCHSDFYSFTENLTYYGKRLSKLSVDTRAVARALEIYLELCEPHVREVFDARALEIMAALEALNSASFITVSGAYFDAQRASSDALLRVLDAELSAHDASALLERVLDITTKTFGATIGAVMLLDAENGCLRVAATCGVEKPELEDVTVRPGEGFTGKIAETGLAELLPDIDEASESLVPILRERMQAAWGVPLKVNESVIGVLIIGFAKPYNWLPSERELLGAIADRSALAIDRARMTDALREREARIVELSAHLLRAQEDERKRISRELHDETGQALMVIRLYLGMLEQAIAGKSPEQQSEALSRSKIQELVGVVDRSIEGIRRIIARLSPLVLQELGLVAAIRKEAKDLTRNAGVRSRVAISDDFGRLNPELEAAIYRVVQESLHNVGKHAQAQSVNIQMSRENGTLRLTVEDDGVGIVSTQNSGRRTFGLAGMRERIAMLGGTLKINSRKGQGTRITVVVPVAGRNAA